MTPEERVTALAVMFSSRGWIEVLKPWIETQLALITDRILARDGSLDENIIRANTFREMLDWERKHKHLADQIEQQRIVLSRGTENGGGEAGSPF